MRHRDDHFVRATGALEHQLDARIFSNGCILSMQLGETCVCVYVMYVCVYCCTHICACTNMTCIYILMYAFICDVCHMCTCAFVWVCLLVCLSVCLRVCARVYAFVSCDRWCCASIHIEAHAHTRTHTHAPTRTHTLTHLHTHTHTHTHTQC